MPLQTTPSALFANAVQTYGSTVNNAARVNLAERSFSREIAQRDAQAMALTGQAVETEIRAIADENPEIAGDRNALFKELHRRRPELTATLASNPRVIEGLNALGEQDPNNAHRKIAGIQQRHNEDGTPADEYIFEIDNAKTKSRGPMTRNGTADPGDEVLSLSGGDLLQRLYVGNQAWQQRFTGLDNRALVDSTKRVSDASVASNNRQASLMRDATLEMGRADQEATQRMQDQINADRQQTIHQTRQPEEFNAAFQQRMAELDSQILAAQRAGKAVDDPDVAPLLAERERLVTSAQTQAAGLEDQRQQEEKIARDRAIHDTMQGVVDYSKQVGLGSIAHGVRESVRAAREGRISEVPGILGAALTGRAGTAIKNALFGQPETQDPVTGQVHLYSHLREKGSEADAAVAAGMAVPGFETLDGTTQERLMAAAPKAYLGVPTDRQVKARANMVYRSMQTASPRTESQLASALYMHSAGKLTDQGLERFVSGQAVAPADVRRDGFTMGPDGRLYSASGKQVGGKDNPIKDIKDAFQIAEDVAGFNRKMAEEATASVDPNWYANLDGTQQEAYAAATAGIAIQANPYLQQWFGVDLSSPNVPASTRQNIMRIAAEVAKSKDADTPWYDFWSDDRTRMTHISQHPQWKRLEEQVRREMGYR